MRTAAAGFLLLASTLSCTVKEDRVDCPCYLQVSFEEKEDETLAGVAGWGEGTERFRNRVRVGDCRPCWVKPVEKGFLTVAAWKGLERASAEGRQIRIPVGAQSDSLYACTVEVDATGDVAPVEVTFRKQFATVFLDIRKSVEAVRSYSFLVEGNSCGADLLARTGVPGMFRFAPEPEEGESIVRFRIPRQNDGSLEVSICPEGSVPMRFPLGEFIAGMDYDWTAEELQDIYIAIDIVSGTAGIGIADWEPGAVFPFVEQ